MTTPNIRVERSGVGQWDVLLTTTPGVVRTVAIRADVNEAHDVAERWASDLGVTYRDGIDVTGLTGRVAEGAKS